MTVLITGACSRRSVSTASWSVGKRYHDSVFNPFPSTTEVESQVRTTPGGVVRRTGDYEMPVWTVARRKRNDRNVVFIRKGIIRICVFISSGATGASFHPEEEQQGYWWVYRGCLQNGGQGDIAEVIVKEHVVRVRNLINPTSTRTAGILCVGGQRARGSFYPRFTKPIPQLFVYIFRHLLAFECWI